MEDINVWIFPIQEEVLVTDQTGGVPVDVCNLPDHYSDRLEKLTGSKSVLYRFDCWKKASAFASSLVRDKLIGWELKHDNWWGREIEAENSND